MKVRNTPETVTVWAEQICDHRPRQQPAFVAEWLMHSAAMCSRAWHAQWPGFDSARARPSTKELFLMIPMHMMNRKLIPGR